MFQLVASAPAFPHGIIDDVQAVAAVCLTLPSIFSSFSSLKGGGGGGGGRLRGSFVVTSNIHCYVIGHHCYYYPHYKVGGGDTGLLICTGYCEGVPCLP